MAVTSFIEHTVAIYSNTNDSRKKIGIGFIVEVDDNYIKIATCKHVVKNRENIQVLEQDVLAKHIQCIDNIDLAILKIEKIESFDNLSPPLQKEYYNQKLVISTYESTSNTLIHKNIDVLIDEETYLNDGKDYRAYKIKLLHDRDKLIPGFSGSPVFNNLGAVVGILAIKEGKDAGYVIAIENLKELDEALEIESFDIKLSRQTKKIKELLLKIPINLFKKTAYFCLPPSYFGKLTDQVNEIVDFLLDIGKVQECVPAISVFETLNKNRPHETLREYISFLKSYYGADGCANTISNIQNASLVINVEKQDGKESYHFTVWRYIDGDFLQIYSFDDKSTMELLEILFDYAKEFKSMYGLDLYFEIVLPDEDIYQCIKEIWKDSFGNSLIRKYKFLFRLQSRFKQPDSSLTISKNLRKKIISGIRYSDDINANDEVFLIKQKIENPQQMLSDIKEYSVPILIAYFNEEQMDIEDQLLDDNIKKNICDYKMNHHNSDKSNFLFLYDDNNIIPEQFREPEKNLYGW